MKIQRILLIAVIFVSAIVCGAPAAIDVSAQLEAIRSTPITSPQRSSREMLIANACLEGLCSVHFSHPEQTPQLVSRWYEAYFETLDPTKIFFLTTDIEEFRRYDGSLWNAKRRIVNLSFAFAVYNRLLERMREWVLYSAEQYDREHDFTVQESYQIYDDYRDAKWPNSPKEQRELWRKRVKNALLVEMLNQEERQANKEKEKETAAPKSKRPDFRTRSKKNLVNAFRRRADVEAIDILEFYLNAFAGLLDPHTGYMKPSTKEQFDISMSLSLEGIGATLTTRDSYTTIVSLVSGGPAAKDGHLKPGDRIIAVAQSPDEEPLDVVDMPLDKVVQRIRGPKGTSVYLHVLPEGAASEYVLKLVREEIVIKDAEAQSSIHKVKLDNGNDARILQIYLPSFYNDFEGYSLGNQKYKNATDDIVKLIRKAREGGSIDGMILDLRGNGGGSLEEAIRISGLFLRGGPVVQIKDSFGRMQVRRDRSRACEYDGPLMLMVDHLSASASEIVAACLQDTGRALVVGDHATHGKGTVQSVIDLDKTDILKNAAGLLQGKPSGAAKVTIGKFYRINGASTQEKGVIPDLVFPSFAEYMSTGEASLPNVLPWDEIRGSRFHRSTNVEQVLPALKKFTQEYMQSNNDFRKYVTEVETFRDFRKQNEVPLEINARRKYRNQDFHLVKMVRRYQPVRASDESEKDALKDEDEDLLADDPAKRKDVILELSLAVMGKFLQQ